MAGPSPCFQTELHATLKNGQLQVVLKKYIALTKYLMLQIDLLTVAVPKNVSTPKEN